MVHWHDPPMYEAGAAGCVNSPDYEATAPGLLAPRLQVAKGDAGCASLGEGLRRNRSLTELVLWQNEARPGTQRKRKVIAF